MPTKTIPLTAVSVQSAKPTTRYGQLAVLPIAATPGAGTVLLRASLSGIPTGAVVSSAKVVMRSRNSPTWAGSKKIKAQALTGAFSTATTWSNMPAATATDEASTTLVAAPAGAFWNLDIQAIAQKWVSGTLANNGVRVVADTGVTGGQFQGATAAWGQPVLVIDYQTAAAAPTALHPSSGAVSKSKPTVQFQTPADTIAIQVQVDPAANAGAPAFDSGEIASSAGMLDLSTTAYAGLADGATTQWRARIKNPLGWSDWASWVTFKRTAWKALTVTSPGATSEDPSPTIQATYAGTITAWRVLSLSDTGKQLQDSGWTPGNAVSFTTTKSVGATGTAVVQIRDNVTRDATPGDPDYLEATQAFTVTPSGSPTSPTLAAASSDGIKGEVVLTGTRATIPDELVIYRNGVLVDRVSGASVFTGTDFTYRDRTAPMNIQHTYKVHAVAAGAWSSASGNKTVTPSCIGIWLYDTETSDAVFVLTDEEQEQSQPEVAIVHRPVSGPDGDPQVVRRRLARYPREGTLEGTLVDAVGVSAATSEANMRKWAEYDAGHKYRLVMGNQNDQVILGDIDFEETPSNSDQQRVVDVFAGWWYQS